MRYLPFIILMGCNSHWEQTSYQPLDDPEIYCFDQAGVTYDTFVMDAEIPETVEQGEIVDLVWHLDTQTYDDYVEPCFQLDLYNLVTGAEIKNLSPWVYPSSGIIQDQIHDYGYYLIYTFRGYQFGEIGLKVYADGLLLDRTTLTVE